MEGREQLVLVGASLATFVVSLVVTRVAIWVAVRARWLAHPVERSSHTTPTPQVGGVGLCVAWILAMVFLFVRGEVSSWAYWSMPAILLAGLVFGLVDDRLALGALAKLALLGILTAIPVSAGCYPYFQLFPQLWANQALAMAVSFLWVLFFTNAFNFMDGVNGQSGVFAMNALFWLGPGLFLYSGFEAPALVVGVAATGIAAIFGFVVWNVPDAKTFMGDSGSLPLGALLAAFAVRYGGGASFGSMPVPLLVLSPFLYDVVYTLIRRLLRGENILKAHRSHLYQRLLIATGWSHARLLAAHLPIWVCAGICGYLYLHAGLMVAWRVAAVMAMAAVLGGYTLFVLRSEGKAREETQG